VNPDLERDLAAWEQGVLSRDELEARHGAEAAVITDTHDTLIRATVGRSIDVNDAWGAFSARLDEPGPVVHLARRRLRTTALAVAATLLLAGSAIAVVGPEVGDGPEVIAPSPASSGGGTSDSPSTDREDIEATTPDHDIDDAGVDGSREPNEAPSTGDEGDDSQGDDSQGDDSQGDDGQDSDDLSDGDQGGDAQGSDPSDGGNSGDTQNDQD
jgi:hypothetical protein